MSVFENAIITLENFGLTDVLIPFLLVFTIVFAVFQKTKILGEGRKNFNIMIGLIMGLAVVIPHVTHTYPANGDVVDIINKALPNVSIVVVAVIMLLLLIGLFGGEANWGGSTYLGLVVIIALVVVIYIFGAAANLWGEVTWLWWLRDPDTQALIVVILVFAVIVWYITKEEKTTGNKFLEGVRDMFRSK